ncbi:hydrocephalus-inducing protein homolog [Pezoporus flaviventris]|uniref:hydrocephalus-inducing protein homolog n=1 Tax=Pezoporus flaviventris TaxID=889875 RepID=UPI002AB1067A|nr:hydrocephalus-inducing protein homolog [Pezoporus flaviventris]
MPLSLRFLVASCPRPGLWLPDPGRDKAVRLRAIVAEPSLSLSRDRLEFSAVQCGQCQEETVQLHNTFQVPCQWSISVNEPVKEVDKHLPASEHQKLLEEMKSVPCGFEVLPSAGTLAPGQQCHVQVRFSPTEEKRYRGELQIQICQSSQRLRVRVLGRGLEPRLEFSPAELELGPLLPQSHGEEGTVAVKTPCEVYSLEFDQQRLAEEQLLRTPKDDNSHNSLLLPPCAPAEKLTGEAQGRGLKVKVDVVDPPGKVVKLGNVCIGQTVKKIVTIASKSAAPLAFQLRVTSTVPELQEAGVLCLKPSKELKLKPRGDSCKMQVTFSPKRRIQPSSGEVLLECRGLALCGAGLLPGQPRELGPGAAQLWSRGAAELHVPARGHAECGRHRSQVYVGRGELQAGLFHQPHEGLHQPRDGCPIHCNLPPLEAEPGCPVRGAAVLHPGQ